MAVIRPFDMIKDLSDQKHLWNIDVRVIDLWYVHKPPKPGHLEMIFMDMKGDRIQVTVKKEEFMEWNEKLTEQKTYVIHNFNVVRNDLQYKACNSPYRLYFTAGTTLKEKELLDIPPMQYQFKNFSDIIAGNFRTGLFVGNYLSVVANSWNGSKLLINEDIVDIQNFKTSFGATEFCASSSQTMTQMSAYSQFSEQDRFFYNAQVKSISDINGLTSTEEITALTVGTTAMFIVGKNGWYYEGCARCTKRSKAQEGGLYKCKESHYSDTWVPRYKLEMKVVHKKDSGRFIFWDSHCAEMIGMSALDLRNKMIEAGEDDLKAYIQNHLIGCWQGP